MTINKKNPPVAVCTDCKEYSNNIALVNERCGKVYNGKRCKGVWGSANNVGDWEECPTCHATGREGSAKCSQCDGYGWLYRRYPA